MKQLLYLSFLLFSIFYGVTNAEVMTGTSYKMDSDSINFAGTISTTTTYYLEDSIGEVATGYSSSTLYSLHAGLLQEYSSYLAVSLDTNNVTMSPSLGGVSGGYSNGSANINVTTDNTAGYGLYIQAEASPALNSPSDSISDYIPSGASPDYDFSISSSQSAFGFSLNGTDINLKYKNDGVSICGTGSTITSLKCWDGLSVTQKIIANSISRNDPSGATTTINFRVGVGSSKIQQNGHYNATTTITAVEL